MSSGIHNYAPLWNEWSIGELLGRGSYGEVYKIHKMTPEGRVDAAAKYISIPKDANDKKFSSYSDEELSTMFKEIANRFSIEISSMMKLRDCKNVVRYEDHILCQKPDGIGWDIIIRMELLTPLEDYLAENVFTKHDVIRMGIDICSAIEACQKNDIIHRDIKIENIFIDNNGNFKLGDFGVSKNGSATATGTITGTEDYMAPEISKEHKYNNTVDIYSLGIVLFRLLNNMRKPFLQAECIPYADDEARAHLQRINGEPLPCPKYDDGELARIIFKACAYDRRYRYATPGEMAADLKNALAILENIDVWQPRKRKTDAMFFIMEGSGGLQGATVSDHEVSTDGGTVGEWNNEDIGSTLTDGGNYSGGGTVSDTDATGGGGGTVSDVLDSSGKVKPKKKTKLFVLLAGLLVLFIGLGAGAYMMFGGSEEILAVAIEGVPEEAVNIVVGESHELTVKAIPEDTTDKFTYESSDKEIAEVDENGKITAIKVGLAEITIKCGTITEKITVNVVNKVVPAEDITGLPESISIETGTTTAPVSATVVPADSTEQTIVYASADESVATVDSNTGAVTGMSAGTTTITAQVGGVVKEITVTVTKKQSSSNNSGGGKKSGGGSGGGNYSGGNTGGGNTGGGNSGGGNTGGGDDSGSIKKRKTSDVQFDPSYSP